MFHVKNPYLVILTICIFLEVFFNPCDTGPFFGGIVVVSFLDFFFIW